MLALTACLLSVCRRFFHSKKHNHHPAVIPTSRILTSRVYIYILYKLRAAALLATVVRHKGSLFYRLRKVNPCVIFLDGWSVFFFLSGKLNCFCETHFNDFSFFLLYLTLKFN